MGKSREQETVQQIDPELQKYALEQMALAESASQIPFSPNRGVRVAAFNPSQVASFDATNAAAQAAGLPVGAMPGMPELQTSNGIQGYGTGDLYDTAKNATVSQPIQDYIDNFFIDPATGAMRSVEAQPQVPGGYSQYAPSMDGEMGVLQGGYSGGGTGGYGASHGGSGQFGGIGGNLGGAMAGVDPFGW